MSKLVFMAMFLFAGVSFAGEAYNCTEYQSMGRCVHLVDGPYQSMGRTQVKALQMVEWKSMGRSVYETPVVWGPMGTSVWRQRKKRMFPFHHSYDYYNSSRNSNCICSSLYVSALVTVCPGLFLEQICPTFRQNRIIIPFPVSQFFCS